MTKHLLTLFTLLLTTSILTAQTNYQNHKYGFSAKVPKDWKMSAEIKDEAGARASVTWTLPQVSSGLEQASVENIVSIAAYRLPEIKSMEDVIKYEIRRMGIALQSVTPAEDTIYTSYIITSVKDDVKYKAFESYVFENGVGYAILFTATPATYDADISQFQNFMKEVEFFKPGE